MRRAARGAAGRRRMGAVGPEPAMQPAIGIVSYEGRLRRTGAAVRMATRRTGPPYL